MPERMGMSPVTCLSLQIELIDIFGADGLSVVSVSQYCYLRLLGWWPVRLTAVFITIGLNTKNTHTG